jgi:DNA replication protein DnaC
LLLDQEASYRRDRRLHARLRYARLRHQAAVEDVDYRAVRGLDRALFQKLAEGAWIDAHESLILCGPTGVGKSWLASGIRRELRCPVKYDQSHWRCTRSRFCSCGSERM